MSLRRLQRLIIVLVLSVLLIGCAGPAAAPTPIDTAVSPTPLPPSSTPTATAIPPTPTSTATATLVPPTHTPTAKPTDPPSATPTRTAVPRPTNTKAPKPTAKPATKAPAALPPASDGVTSVTVRNTFPLSCVIAFWGPSEFKLDASANDGIATREVAPGVYGWRAFIGGAQTGEAGNLTISAGQTCLFICDKDKLAIRYGCK